MPDDSAAAECDPWISFKMVQFRRDRSFLLIPASMLLRPIKGAVRFRNNRGIRMRFVATLIAVQEVANVQGCSSCVPNARFRQRRVHHALNWTGSGSPLEMSRRAATGSRLTLAIAIALTRSAATAMSVVNVVHIRYWYDVKK
jgi:hypothetical protein